MLVRYRQTVRKQQAQKVGSGYQQTLAEQAAGKRARAAVSDFCGNTQSAKHGQGYASTLADREVHILTPLELSIYSVAVGGMIGGLASSMFLSLDLLW